MNTAIEAVNEIASEHLEILTANPFDTMTRVVMQEQFSWVSILLNLLEIIMQVPTCIAYKWNCEILLSSECG